MYYILFILLLLALFFILLFHFRKKKIIRKICRMSREEKCHILDELIWPLGYRYDSRQDIFSSTVDAWQKKFGYTGLYDKMAPFFNMIFDCQPVYFDYGGKTWLIEFWKGQYGITTGAEIGIYHADHILAPAERESAVFSAVQPEEYLEMEMELFHRGKCLASRRESHWWLTAFSVGRFSRPEDLSMNITLHFPDFEMRSAFIDAYVMAGYGIKSLNLRLYSADLNLRFGPACRTRRIFRRIHRAYVQWKNKLFRRLYCLVTRPFCKTIDKLLYLYFFLPFLFRRTLHLRHFGRRGQERRRP